MTLTIKKSYFFSVPFDHRISNLNINLSRHVIFVISDGKYEGIGEGVLYKGTALSSIRFYKEKLLPFLAKSSFKNIKEAREIISRKFGAQNSGLVCAIDLALWDIEAKRSQKTLLKLLGPLRNSLDITEEIFIDQFNEKSLDRIKKDGTKKLKIKIGKNTLKNYKQKEQLLNKFKFNIRADANQSFKASELTKMFKVLKNLKIKVIEEPVSAKDQKHLRHKENIILDESIITREELSNALKNGFGIYNIKISRLGGITRSLQFIREIEARNKKVIIGCSEELGIATYGLLCLAASVRNLHSVEGLGSQRLGFDIINQRLTIKNGKIKVPSGVEFSKRKLQLASQKFGFKISENGQLNYDFLLYEIKQDILGKFKNLWAKITK